MELSAPPYSLGTSNVGTPVLGPLLGKRKGVSAVLAAFCSYTLMHLCALRALTALVSSSLNGEDSNSSYLNQKPTPLMPGIVEKVILLLKR